MQIAKEPQLIPERTRTTPSLFSPHSPSSSSPVRIIYPAVAELSVRSCVYLALRCVLGDPITSGQPQVRKFTHYNVSPHVRHNLVQGWTKMAGGGHATLFYITKKEIKTYKIKQNQTGWEPGETAAG